MGSGGAEGRRASTPAAKIADVEIAAEDRRLQLKVAKACALHLQDLIRWHGVGRKSAAGRPRMSPPMLRKVRREENENVKISG